MNHSNDRNSLTGTILEIQRMSTEDGPGIRTTVFFKGCCLQCTWCHNPESISPHPQLHWVANRCIGCHTCLKTCPAAALTATADGIRIDRKTCTGCGLCAAECPATALECLGADWTVADLMRELLKDKAYYEASGGGVSLGGGEPTQQARFVAPLLKQLKQNGLHTALDTCGLCAPAVLETLLPHVDLLLYDLKEIEPQKHRQFTGGTNALILENLRFVRALQLRQGFPRQLWIRTPIIPDTTARAENIRGIGGFIAAHLDGCVQRWELCAFNNLCQDKYRRLDMQWTFKEHALIDRKMMEHLADVAKAAGVDPAIVHWSGSTRMEAKTV